MLNTYTISRPENTILFVDDELHIRIALERTLGAEPYQCLFASNGREAMALLDQNPVQVLISDMRMPEMNGTELLKEVATQFPDIVRLVLSGWSDNASILKAVNEGHIYQYITKPWDKCALKVTIHQALEFYRLQQEKRELLRCLEEHNRLLEKRIEQRTQQILSMHCQAEIGKYASQIVHNLNNPLQALEGALDLTKLIIVDQKERDPAKIAKVVETARLSAADLRRIVAGILHHARCEHHSEFEAINVNAIIKRELDFFELNRRFRVEVEKKLQLATGLPAALGNAVQIKQVMDNLIGNAIDAMADSPIKRLKLSTSANDDFIVIEIEDSGKGIPQKDLPYIFDPDFSTKPADQGTGLGLASAKRLTEACGGMIQVQSEEGQGATFIVRLPIFREQTALPAKRVDGHET